jgi:hypothetical protein
MSSITSVRNRLRPIVSVITLAILGSVLGSPQPAKAAIGDLTYVRCYSRDLLSGGTDKCPGGRTETGRPQGIITSPDGRFLYTWSGTEFVGSRFVGRILVHERDASGGLTYRGCHGSHPVCVQFSDTLVGVEDVVMTPDGVAMYAVDYAGASIYGFVRNAQTGGLSLNGCWRDAQRSQPASICAPVPALSNPVDVALTENNGQGVFVATIAGGLTSFRRNPANGQLQFVGCIHAKGREASGCTTAPGLSGASHVAVAPDGTSVFVAGLADVVHFRRPSDDALVFTDCFGNAKSDSQPAPKTVGDPACAPVPGLGGISDIGVHPSGIGVFVTATMSDALSYFVHSTGDRRLYFIGCLRDVRKAAAGCDGIPVPRPIYIAAPTSVNFSGDGSTVYVSGGLSDSIVPFSVDRNNGSSPTQRGCFLDVEHPGEGCAKVQGLDGPLDAVVTPDFGSVYVAAPSDFALAQFTRVKDDLCQRIPVACQFPGSDTTAPDTTITSAPKAKTRSSVAVFSFVSDDAEATFECSLDGAAPEPCASPRAYAELAKGSHTFHVVAIDPAGNRDGSPAEAAWKVRPKRRR